MNFTVKTENQPEYSEIKKIKGGEVAEYPVKIVFTENVRPKPFSIIWEGST